ncbi:unnamed protein product, partial [marine sediment metagenome]
DWLYGKSLRDIILEEWRIKPQYVADILKADPSNTDQPIKTRILHTLLEGPIDADKLDYLVRDSLQRLAGISQLGLLVQVYPTATHSRLEHTLGAFTNVVQYVTSLYHDLTITIELKC